MRVLVLLTLIPTLVTACGQKQRPAPATAPQPNGAPAAPSPDPTAAVSLVKVLDDACKKGDARSCFVLGQKLRAGRGVEKDEARGTELLVKACDGGHEQACVTAGRPMPYTAEVQASVPASLRLGAFESVSIGSFLGPDGDRVREALSKPVERGCDCLVSYGKDLDFMGDKDLLLAGVVLDHRVSATREPLDKVTREEKPELSALIPGKAAGDAAGQGAPEQCRAAHITARLWLIHGRSRKAPPSVLVHGRGGPGPCDRSVEGAIADLARSAVAILTNRYTRKVTLFKDSNLPALEEGNGHARNGAWQTALHRYKAAGEQAAKAKLAAATRGHARYLQGLALAHLRRYEAALAALKQAREINPDDRYLLEMERVIVAGGEGWSAPPPVERKAKEKRKRRRLYWQPRLKRKVVWE